MNKHDIDSMWKLHNEIRKITSFPKIRKTRQSLNELQDKIISPENSKNMKHIRDLQNKMISPAVHKQIRSMYRWNRLFAPDTDFFENINRYNDIQKIRESSVNKQINQFKEITKLQPSFNLKLRNLSNKLAQMNTNQLHDFYNTNLKNGSTYKNYVNYNNKEKKKKTADTSTSVKAPTEFTTSKNHNLQKHCRNSGNTVNVTNNDSVTNNYNNKSNASSIEKWSLVLSILSIILGIVLFLASNNPNQVTSNLNLWTESISKITKR